MNILLTCAGRRNYLVRFFQTALHGSGRVIAGDASPTAPALQEADIALILPPVSDVGYVNTLLQVCRQLSIRLLVSLNDLELPILATERERFAEAGTILVVSSPEVVDICFDKQRTARWLTEHRLPTASTYSSLCEAWTALEAGMLSWPVVIKPRWGTASIGIQIAEDQEELTMCLALLQKQLGRTFLKEISATDPDRSILIQERLVGDEYGLDVVNDLDGNYMCTFVKRKLAMRAGETDRALTVFSPELEDLGERIGQSLGHIGNLDCDVFVADGVPRVLEMNPRFGGGYPFSHVAGADIPAAIVAWARGVPVDPGWLRLQPEVVASKYSEVVLINQARISS